MDIPSDDRGLTLGVGLFETILVSEGEPAFWDDHMQRLARGCALLRLPAPDAKACAYAAHDVLRPHAGLLRAALRLTWTGGSGARGLAGPRHPQPRLIASAAPAPDPPASITLATSTIRRNPSSPASRLKTLSYLDNVAAREAALAAGADEALLLSTDGFLSGGAAANLFWYRHGILFTPALDCGVLDGIMRTQILRAARAAGVTTLEVRARPEELQACEGAFLTNSLIGAVAVALLDGHPLPPLTEGRVFALEKRNQKTVATLG
jgi:branched-chain amino acid aminotransferase/4-amino-4-deoxychorismate lyase